MYDPLTPALPHPPPNPAPPSADHWLGTDPYGSDVLSQLMYGAGSALLLGTVAALVTVVLATGVGAAAAYYGGLFDAVFMRLSDLILMTPLLVILIFLSAFFELRLLPLAIWIGVFAGLGGTVLVVKAQALAIKNRAYIDAARAGGAGGALHPPAPHDPASRADLAAVHDVHRDRSGVFGSRPLLLRADRC